MGFHMSKEQKENETIDLFEKILSRSEKEVERVYKYYRLAASLVGLIIAVGIYVSYASISDFKDEIRKDVSDFKSSLKQQTKIFTDSLNLDTNNKVALVQKAIVSKIDEEFDKEKISDLVEIKASDRVDKVADRLIKGQIDERVDKKIKLSEVELGKLIEKTQYQLLELKALNDDRLAFDSLLVISGSKSPYAVEARASVENIMTEYENLSYGLSASGGDEYLKQDINEIRKASKKLGVSERIGIIWYIWNLANIKIKDRLEFFVDLVRLDRSLKVVSAASEKIIALKKLPFRKLDITKILNWWEKEKKLF